MNTRLILPAAAALIALAGMNAPAGTAGENPESPSPLTTTVPQERQVLLRPVDAGHAPSPPWAPETPSRSLSSAWSPESELMPVDEYIDGGQSVATDSHGTPYVVWYAKVRDSLVREVAYWTRWEGDHWRARERVAPDDPGWVHKPRIAFDEGDTAWVVWNRHEGHEIWYARGRDGEWWGSQAVHEPDPYDYYSPEIACGGGEVWLTWYGKGAVNEYDVFVTRWNGTAWEPAVNLTENRPGYHWFCDIAVDNEGVPHLIWGDSSIGVILYVTKPKGGSWTEPSMVNAGPRIRAAGWPMAHIEVDDAGIKHIVWVGRELSETGTYGDQDVYYSRNLGSAWSGAVRINEPDDEQAYYPDFSVRDSTDIWIAWGDDGDSWTEATAAFAAHFDGKTASGETRLDSGRFHWNDVPRVALDGVGLPWVFWGAIHGDFSESSILYSRYLLGGEVPVLLSHLTARAGRANVDLAWEAEPDAFIRFRVEHSVNADAYTTCGRVESSLGSTYRWRDAGVPAGLHLYRICGLTRTGETMTLGPVAVTVGAPPAELTMAPAARATRERLAVEVGMPVAGLLKACLFDIQGRLASTFAPAGLEAGWSTVELRPAPAGLRPGVYFLRIEAAGAAASAKVVLLD